MKILIREGASREYVWRCYRHAPPTCGMRHRPEFARMLEQVQGKWLEVETEHLFRDQFNTAPIPGVSASGLRVMLESVAAIEDDARVGTWKCGWCGTCGRDTEYCPKCSKPGSYWRPPARYWRPLDPLFPYTPSPPD